MRTFPRTSSPLMVLVGSMMLAACGASTTETTPETTPPGTESTPPAESATAADPRTDEEVPAAPFCSAGPAVGYDVVAKAIFDALEPEEAAAYLALRQNVGTIPSPGLSEDLELVAERGQRCGDAANATACTTAYEALRPPVRLGYHHCYTRGDAAACVESGADALALLGHVSSIEEAFFVAEYAGYLLSCSTSYVAARGTKLADGSFQLVLGKQVAGGTCGQLHRAVVNVARDGTVRELESKLANATPACP